MSQSRQLAAIMFTDIVGYTALMDEDEQKAFELLKKNRQVQRPIIEKYNGKWLKEMGDGVLASFSTVTDAVFCAAAIQKTCEDEPDLNLRIGIHQGEVVFEGEDVFGSGVNIASRLEPLAPIGGILVSESVNRNLGNKQGIETSFVREETLKNVKDPIKVYAVKVAGVETPEPMNAALETPVADAAPKSLNPKKIGFASLAVIIALVLAYYFYSRQSPDNTQPAQPEITDKSIAVLPFKNDSPDADNQYFADGMMDEILNHLQKITELGVKSRTAVEPYRNSTQSFATIAKELDVAFVLEGAVRKYGDRFRVTTQLIEVESGNHLWSDTYDGTFSDTIFVVQSNIAKNIASSLNTVITPDEEKSIDRIPTTDMAAYDLYVRANHELQLYWSTLDKKHLKAAHKFYDHAIQIDPNYLMATVGKGMTFIAERNYDSAFVYAEKVLAVDPESSKGYELKGEYYFFTGNLDLAIENYQKAIDVPLRDSKWFWYHLRVGRTYLVKNEVIKGLPYLYKGLGGDNEDLGGVYFWMAFAYINIGDYDKSKIYRQRAAKLGGCEAMIAGEQEYLVQGKFQEALQFADSNCQQAECEKDCFRLLFKASLLLGEFEKAEQYFYQWQNTGQDHLVFERRMNYEIGYVYNQLGRTEEAEKIFEEQIKILESYLDLARIYAFTGKKKEALRYLTKYGKKGFDNGWHDFILIDPFFESLRDDPEFKAIVKQAQEEKAALREQVRQMEERGELTL